MITKTSKNLNIIVTALSYFDNIISGNYDYYTAKQITDKHVSMLLGLFIHSLNGDEGKEMEFDDYILSTFQTFIHHKTKIILDLSFMARDKYTNAKIRDFIMYPLRESCEKRDENDKINLFKPCLLKIFKKVKAITLDITYFSISLVKLLSMIKCTSIQQVNVYLDDLKSSQEWISSEWSSSEMLINLYRESHFTIQYKEGVGFKNKRIGFVIERNLDYN